MSMFNSYARRADEVAKKAFLEYQKAEKDLERAKLNVKAYPHKSKADAVYIAKSAKYAAEYEEAKVTFMKAQNALERSKSDIKKIRDELETVVNSHYAARPSEVDNSMLELLKSGILNAYEYERLMNEAKADGNYTMMRIIGKYAADQAEKEDPNTDNYYNLRAVSISGSECSGKKYLDSFEVISEAYNKTANNPGGMIDYWDSLTSEIVENF